MKRFLLSFLIFSACIFSGCQKNTAPLCRFVTSVEITGQNHTLQFSRKYTENNQIEAFLQCLRGIRTRQKVTHFDSERVRTHFVITVHLSDGARHTYALVGHRYFKAPQKPWVEINHQKAVELYQAIQNNETMQPAGKQSPDS